MFGTFFFLFFFLFFFFFFAETTKLRDYQDKIVSLFIQFLLFTYPTVSKTCINFFDCNSDFDAKTFLSDSVTNERMLFVRGRLKSDYRVDCDSAQYHSYMSYGVFMALLYLFGLPLSLAVLLYRARKRHALFVYVKIIIFLISLFSMSKRYY